MPRAASYEGLPPLPCSSVQRTPPPPRGLRREHIPFPPLLLYPLWTHERHASCRRALPLSASRIRIGSFPHQARGWGPFTNPFFFFVREMVTCLWSSRCGARPTIVPEGRGTGGRSSVPFLASSRGQLRPFFLSEKGLPEIDLTQPPEGRVSPPFHLPPPALP